MDRTEIVVGTDGSASGTAAVRWAMREASRRGTALRAILAYDRIWECDRSTGAEELRRMAQSRAEIALADSIMQSADLADGVPVRRAAVVGEPVPVLLEAAGRAALVVVGNRGRGGFTSLLLGSVAQRVATHARCPVVVVRGRADTTDGPVVVGIDGSANAEHALGLGFWLAAERGAALLAIRSCSPPLPPWGVDIPQVVYDPDRVESAERDALADALAPWRDKFPQVSVEGLVARGSAARVLVGVSHTAQLVVVGSRGHGGFAGTLLGSVGLQLLHHADCPVLIARAEAHS